MGIIAEIFRVEDWRRTPVRVWAPPVAWVVVAFLTNLVLLLIHWPTTPWRLLMALMAGVLASGLVRWMLGRRQQESAMTTE